jgi:hypothetical protein
MSYHVLTYRPPKAYRHPRNRLPSPLEKPQPETMGAAEYAAAAYAVSGGLYSSSLSSPDSCASSDSSDSTDSPDSSDSSGSPSSDSGSSSSD